jgi:UDP-glucose 4-epimerase
MDKYNVKNIVFSSSATVYNSMEKLPWNEETYT